MTTKTINLRRRDINDNRNLKQILIHYPIPMPTLISYILNLIMSRTLLMLSIFLILDPNKVITIIKQRKRMRRNITKTIKAATIIT